MTHAERNPALGRIDVDHYALNLVAYIDKLGGMLHALRPRHLADVNQAFNALLQFDECAVVGDANDAPRDMRSHGIAVLGVEPRIRRELLESERNPLLIFIVLEDLNLNLVADIDEVFRVRETSPRHVGDVEQAVETAEIDERAVLGKVLDDPSQNRAFFEMFERFRALFSLLAFEQLFARDDDVAALFVQLDDRDFDGLAFHAIEIPDGPQVHLRAGQEGVRSEDVDRQSALDAVNDDGLDWLFLVIGLLDLFPGMNALGLLVRKRDVTFLGLALVAHHVDFVARLKLWLAFVIEDLRKRQHAFRFRADIYDHMGGRELKHGAFDHAVFADRLFGFGGEGLERRGEVFAGGGSGSL